MTAKNSPLFILVVHMKFNTTIDIEMHTVEVDIDAHVEDFGIGPYEFWGAKGNDVQLGYELDNVNILSVKIYDEFGSYDVTDPVVIKEIEDSAEFQDAVDEFLSEQEI